MPLITFGQTNNELDNSIKCVAGAKRISENVDSVSYLKRKTEAERALDGVGTHMMKLFKQRSGPGAHEGYVNFDADLSCGDFEDLGMGSTQTRQQADDDSE